MVPEANATEEGGQLAQRFPELWSGATLQERHRLLVSMLEAVYVDHKEDNAVVAIRPKPTFRAVFQVATTREGSGVILIKEPPSLSEGSSVFMVETGEGWTLHAQYKFARGVDQSNSLLWAYR